MSAVRILSPAKINIGLAILGKRPDGYHEIDTIMAMLDLADVLTVRESTEPGVSIAGMDDVPIECNLITKAIHGWCQATNSNVAYEVDIQKNIPSPAGLGGGSSNAAAAIRALDAIHPGAMSREEMSALAASLGADCPFFLGSATARATGIGTNLQAINVQELSAVIVVPPTPVAAKTARLYGSLTPADYDTHERIDAIQDDLQSGVLPTLRNSFSRAAFATFPEIAPVWEYMERLNGSRSLSGAGPAVFSLTNDREAAEAWADEMRAEMPWSYFVTSARLISQPPTPEFIT